uniref:alpha carbonic anhydrase 4-like n=1 Tax=Erigeron canadensis TaxID=72917 RepID=UPI001CB9D621|nr:alpha carbonic anhydrase 4-like [Erigeron canadensis]
MTSPNLSSLLFTFLIVSSLSLIVICNAAPSEYNRYDAGDEKEFSYEESAPDGPEKWGSLSAEWKVCSDGKSQSPINIDTKKAKEQSSDLKKSYKEAPAKIFNRHHNIAVEWQGDAGSIEVNGSTFKLVQCHWHTPAEHTIDGKKYDAELHFVHSNENDQKAVLGLLYAVGESDPFIKDVIASKIKGLGSNGNDLGEVSAGKITSDNNKYFRYIGSLTTPPCSEGVIWTVAEKVRPISEEQIKLLKGALDPDFQENARPVVELNGRPLTQFKDEEGAAEDSDHSGADSSAILKLWNGIIITVLVQMFFSFLF